MELVELFKPGKIGNMQVRNKIVMPPMLTLFADQDGCVTERLIGYYEARAKGGVGLIITEAAPILPESRPSPKLLGIHDDVFISGLKRLVKSLKAHGSKVVCQIAHFGRRTTEFNPNMEGIGPSATTHSLFGTIPRELSKDDIKLLVEAYGEAAKRAIEAGYDGIEIHGAHGMLVNQFLSPWTNRRTDQYGGSIENRARFACEIIRKVREKIGSEFSIILRMQGDDGFEGGIRIGDASIQAPLFEKAGADALHVSAGAREGIHWQLPTLMQESGCLTHLSTAIKKVVHIPVITVGKIGNPSLAEDILKYGKADFIAMGRALIADPEIPIKAREGRAEDIRPCIYCNACRDQRRAETYGIKQSGLFCAVNPVCGREWEYKSETARSPKHVLVIGAGLAGMEAAGVLSERGHRVSLYERDGIVGGQWAILSASKPDVAGLIRYLSRRLERLGVKMLLNQEIDKAFVEKINPDTVVVATGARQVLPAVDGIQAKNVVLASDVLSGKVEVGQEVVIIGGRLVGLTTACFLAKQGKRVSVVTKSAIARDLRITMKLFFREYLVNHGVYLYPNSVPVNISEKGLNIINDGEIIFLRAVNIIVAVGSKAENKLVEELKGVVPEVYAVGDCVKPRNVLAAIHDASRVGHEI